MSAEEPTVRVFKDKEAASVVTAGRIAELIRHSAEGGKPFVLGLATGQTPVTVYRLLAKMHRGEGLDFSQVVTFNLDEYWPIDPTAPQSYYRWMHEQLFNHINVPPDNVHIPSGDVGDKQMELHCRQYEEGIAAAGGIDFQVLGIGRNGHIGFNEPDSAPDSRTRRIQLDSVTRKDAADDFSGDQNVPQAAITMGIGTILEAREIHLLAFGEHKAPAIRRAIDQEVSPNVPASLLRAHSNVTFCLDEGAASGLSSATTGRT